MEALIISNVLLWVLVIGLGVVTVALARQVGILHERSAPLGAVISDKGPEVGEHAPEFQLEDLSGKAVQVGGKRESGRDTLLLFLAPNCPMCNKLLPTALSMASTERLDVIIVSDGPREEHDAFLRKHDLGGLPYVVSANVGIRFQVGRVPYAILIDNEGTIRSKGLVNTREHLESLVEAKDTGVQSIQEYLKRHRHTDREEVAEVSATHSVSGVRELH